MASGERNWKMAKCTYTARLTPDFYGGCVVLACLQRAPRCIIDVSHTDCGDLQAKQEFDDRKGLL